jgi:RNA polymerase sigma-70 factor, ECF subfamily
MAQQPPAGEITGLLAQWRAGHKEPVSKLFSAVYDDLRQIARGYMRNERADHTLQASALVNEAYAKLFQGKPFHWENRKHFFCTMAQTMRYILVDYAREHQAQKRGGKLEKVSLDGPLPIANERIADLLVLNDALERLAELCPRQGQVVEMRFFVGLTVDETAAILNVSPETVKLDWRFAKSWLRQRMRSEDRGYDPAPASPARE